MPNYQGPNVSVTQKFITSPAAIAIEDLPAVAVGTAYDVYEKESLGNFFGINPTTALSWGTDNTVVVDKDVIGQKGYDFYPVETFAQSVLGNIALENISGKNSDGITIGVDQDYELPNTAQPLGVSEAIIPYYKKIFSTDNVTISAANLSVVNVVGGTVVSAKIKPGQKVFVTVNGGSAWVEVGIVGSVGSDESKIYLATPYSAAITTGDGIVVGAASTTLVDNPDTIYDTNAHFKTNGMKVGDLIKFSSQSFAGSQPKIASVSAIINDNTLQFNTVDLAAGQVDVNYLQYKFFKGTQGSTVNIYAYTINRLAGFSQNYGFKSLAGDADKVVNSTTTSFTYTVASGTPALLEGDKVMFTDAKIASGVEERDTTYLRLYEVDTVSSDGSIYTVTFTDVIYQSGVSGEVAVVTDDFINAWTPKVSSNILSNFRAIRSEENGVVKRIQSERDITDAWCRGEEINIHNELAYMSFIELSAAGGRVVYGANVNSAATNLTAEYAAALEELKLVDVYSHAFGTTDAGVNSLMGTYCDSQADPYEAHERIAIVTYDSEDVFTQAIDSGSVANTGLITTAGAISLVDAGVSANDFVIMYDASGNELLIAKVTETPTVANLCQTDYDGSVSGTVASFRFVTGNKSVQADMIKSLGSSNNRRVKAIWPGWFYGDVGDDRKLLPPYYISSQICGRDSSKLVSQSFTNMPFAPAGISGMQLNTSGYFRKAMLDAAASAGVDIMIQDAVISNTIKSRHDLTTNMDAIEYREWSITKQVDVCAKTLRSAVAPYVGRYNIDDALIQFLGQVTASAISTLVREGTVSSISITGIERDEIVVDKVNFYITVTVFVAGNYYDIQLLVKSK